MRFEGTEGILSFLIFYVCCVLSGFFSISVFLRVFFCLQSCLQAVCLHLNNTTYDSYECLFFCNRIQIVDLFLMFI